jgi:hypothetical protein
VICTFSAITAKVSAYDQDPLSFVHR